MKKILFALALCVAGFLQGCANSCCSDCGSGLVDPQAERARRYKLITNINCREAVDDWDYLWLYDKNSSLTQWHPVTGY